MSAHPALAARWFTIDDRGPAHTITAHTPRGWATGCGATVQHAIGTGNTPHPRCHDCQENH